MRDSYRLSKFQKVLLCVCGAYFLLLLGFTLYSNSLYSQMLPEVELTVTVKRQILYVKSGTAVCRNGVLRYVFPPKTVMLDGVIGQNCPVDIIGKHESGKGLVRNIGSLHSVSFYCDIEITKGEFSEGEELEVVIYGNAQFYENTIPRSAIIFLENGTPSISLVDEQSGPWGRKYVITRRKLAYIWPEDTNSDYVALPPDFSTGIPIVTTNSTSLFSGTEVRVKV